PGCVGILLAEVVPMRKYKGELMQMINVQEHLDALLAIIQRADEVIMDVYNTHSAIATTKADNTPITQADVASHEVITRGLAALFPSIPIVSEEGDEQENIQTIQTIGQGELWLVDPLDGTEEFLNRTGDFTVCVALVEDGLPVFGVISAPAHGLVYYGGPETGSYKRFRNKQTPQ